MLLEQIADVRVAVAHGLIQRVHAVAVAHVKVRLTLLQQHPDLCSAGGGPSATSIIHPLPGKLEGQSIKAGCTEADLCPGAHATCHSAYQIPSAPEPEAQAFRRQALEQRGPERQGYPARVSSGGEREKFDCQS